MGLLDSITGMLGGGGGQAAAAGGGGQAALLQAVMGMLNHGQGAGLGNLAAAFQQGGLGHIFDSWVSNGANQPVSPAQVTQVLGQGQIAQIAQQTGMAHGDVASALSQLLPQIVNHVTPQGQLPQSGQLGGLLSSLAGKLLG